MTLDTISTSNQNTPDELETLVASMAKVGFCYSPSFSPDVNQIAFISDLNGIPQVSQ